MSLSDELSNTLRMVQALKARSPDELEDYFHDSVLDRLEGGHDLEGWLPYIYKSVRRKIEFGREAREHLPFQEELVEGRETSLSLRLDLDKALNSLAPRKRALIYQYYYLDRTLRDIAREWNVSFQAVSTMHQRALKEMREFLR